MNSYDLYFLPSDPKSVFYLIARNYCKLCGYPLNNPKNQLCRFCRLNDIKYNFQYSRSLVPYRKNRSDSFSKYLHLIKDTNISVNFKWDYLKKFNEIITYFYNINNSYNNTNCIVSSIPTYPLKIQQRGIDHVAALCNHYCQIINKKNFSNLLNYTRKPDELRDLGRRERFQKTYGLFNVNTKVDGQEIIIFDDVFTTGATMHDAARAFITAGAKKCFGFTFARTV